MVSKKDKLTIGLLAIGGVGAALMVADSGDSGGGGIQERFGRILGSAPSNGAAAGADAPSITYQIPAQGAVTFPEPVDYADFLSQFFAPEPVSRGTQGVSGAGKKRVIYGGYKPSGQTYVFGGKAFEQQAASEVVSQGYSPTLAAAFGIAPEIAAGDSKKTVTTYSGRRRSTSYGGRRRSTSYGGRRTSASKRARNIAAHAAGLSGAKKRSYLRASAAQARARGE